MREITMARWSKRLRTVVTWAGCALATGCVADDGLRAVGQVGEAATIGSPDMRPMRTGAVTSVPTERRTYEVTGFGTLVLDVPTSWREERLPAFGGTSKLFSIRFFGEGGDPFSVHIGLGTTSVPQGMTLPPDLLRFSLTTLVESVETASRAARAPGTKPQSDKAALDLKHFRARGGEGYYYEEIDEKWTPGVSGEYRHLLLAVAGIENYFLVVTVVSNDPERAADALRVAQNAERLNPAEGETGRPSAGPEPILFPPLDVLERHLGPFVVFVTSGRMLLAQGKFREAEDQFRRALASAKEAGATDEVIELALGALIGIALVGQERFAEAEPLIRRAMTHIRSAVGPEHPAVGVHATYLGLSLFALERFGEAEQSFREALRILDKSPQPHPIMATASDGLGNALCHMGRFGEAEPFFRRALAIDAGSPNPSPQLQLSSSFGLGWSLAGQGRYAESEPLLAESLAASDRQLGVANRQSMAIAIFLGNTRVALRKWTTAEPLWRRILAFVETEAGAAHEQTGFASLMLAYCLAGQGRFIESVAFARRAWEIRERALGARSDGTIEAAKLLVVLLRNLNRNADAEGVLRHVLEGFDASAGIRTEVAADVAVLLGDTLGRQGKHEEAEQWHRKGLAWFEEARMLDGLSVPVALRGLALAAQARGELAQAEALLRKAAGALRPGHPLTVEILGDFARVLRANGKETEASAVEARLRLLPLAAPR